MILVMFREGNIPEAEVEIFTKLEDAQKYLAIFPDDDKPLLLKAEIIEPVKP